MSKGSLCAPGDDELREGRGRELVEGNLGLPGMALHHQRPGALDERGRELSGRNRGADPFEERAQERRRVAGLLPEEGALPLVGVDDGVAVPDSEARRLDHGQRADAPGVERRGEERDHAAVRVPDEVRARLDVPSEPVRLVLEVDARHLGAGREAAPVRHDELEPLGERPLRRPCDVAVHDAPVHEEDARTAHEGDSARRTNSPRNRVVWRNRSVTSSGVCSGTLALLMQAASPSSLNPAGAGGLLLAVLVAGIGAGLLVGWAVGSPAIGALVGSVAGVLGGIYAVYRRYRGAF